MKRKNSDLQPDECESSCQKTPDANLVRYAPSGKYFARIRVGGKLIRQSLKTKVLAFDGIEAHLRRALEALVSPETIEPWLKDPNPAFDGSTPLQVIERGETDRIWRMIYELESGEPG